MTYKLIASDMDGTLLNSESQLTQRTKDAILGAVGKGAYFVTATGRPFCNTRIVNDIFDEGTDMPFIVLNGSAAYMGKSKKLLFETFLNIELAKEAFRFGQQLGLPQVIWAGCRLFANRECDETLRYRDFSTVAEMGITSDLDDIIDDIPGISKVLWIADPSFVAERHGEMLQHFGGRLNCYTSRAQIAHFLEFVSRDASKGKALEHIGKMLNIDRSEIMAFGDAYNDLSMLEYAGFSVAVDNAPDDIKAACGYVTASNDNDGVAAVIEEYILNSLTS